MEEHTNTGQSDRSMSVNVSLSLMGKMAFLFLYRIPICQWSDWRGSLGKSNPAIGTPIPNLEVAPMKSIIYLLTFCNGAHESEAG